MVWDHVNIGHIQRAIRKTIIYAIFAAMIIFWMVPGKVPLLLVFTTDRCCLSLCTVLFAASITNLTRLSRLGAFKWLRGLLEWKPALTRLVEVRVLICVCVCWTERVSDPRASRVYFQC